MTFLSEIDLNRAAEIFASIPCRRELAILEIAEEVSDATGIPMAVLVGENRAKHIAHARQLAYYIAHREGFTLPEIGRVFRRDHTTVLHGVRQESIRRGELQSESAISAASLTGGHPADEKGDRQSSEPGVTATNPGRRSLAPMAAGSNGGTE